jgi:aminoglycoside/choline kinase family phosphotransferase
MSESWRASCQKSRGVLYGKTLPLRICLPVFMTLPPASHAPDTRLQLLAAWLHNHANRYALDLATLVPASSDASFRRYFRLAGKEAEGAGVTTLIAVDAPPPEKCREFAQIAKLLSAAGVNVPRVLEVDFEAGFMLVTDLGTTVYLSALNPGNARALMRDALDALIRWQLASQPDVLPPFDEAFLRREMELLPEWFIGRHLGREVDEKTHGLLDRTFALLVASARAQPQVFMLRDFMPRNLMLMPEPNPANPGVLDFQDAVYGPITYDVASLLRDAFLSWDEEFELDCFVYYWERAKKAGLPVDADFGEFYRQLEWMGLQRHIKVLGLFCRINYRDHKPHYMKDLPRFIGYARKVAGRYRPLGPFAKLLDELEGRADEVGYTF